MGLSIQRRPFRSHYNANDRSDYTPLLRWLTLIHIGTVLFLASPCYAESTDTASPLNHAGVFYRQAYEPG